MGVSFNDITNLANVMSASGARQQASNDATARTGLARDQLGLAKRAQGHAENQDVIQQARKSRAEIMKQISDVVATGVMDTNPDQGRQLIQKYGKTLAGLYTAGSGDPQESQKRAAIDVQAALARPNMMQSADLAGRTQGAQTNATDAAIGAPGATGRGREADIASTQAATSNAAANAARTRQATDQEAGAVMNMLNSKTGAQMAIMLSAENAADQIAKATAEGFVQMGKPTLQAATAADLGGGIPKNKRFATPAQRAEIQGEVQRLTQSTEDVKKIIEDIALNPSRYGAIGSIKKGAQTLGGILGDAAEAFNLGDQAAKASEMLSSVADTLGLENKSEFDTIAQTDPIRARLMLDLATTWQRQGRPLAAAVEAAKDITALRGFSSSKATKSKMEEILRELEAGRDDAISRLETLEGGPKVSGGGSEPKAAPRKLSDISVEEMRTMSRAELERLAE